MSSVEKITSNQPATSLVIDILGVLLLSSTTLLLLEWNFPGLVSSYVNITAVIVGLLVMTLIAGFLPGEVIEFTLTKKVYCAIFFLGNSALFLRYFSLQSGIDLLRLCLDGICVIVLIISIITFYDRRPGH